MTNRKTAKTTARKQDSALVYCGPTNRLVTQSTTFIGGYPPHLIKHLEAFPALKSLFVPANQLAEHLKKIETPGTAEEAVYRRASEYWKGVTE